MVRRAEKNILYGVMPDACSQVFDLGRRFGGHLVWGGWKLIFLMFCFSHRKPRRVCERNVIPVDGKVGRMHEDVWIVVQDGVQSLAAVQDKLLPVVVLFAPLASVSFQSVMGQSALGKTKGEQRRGSVLSDRFQGAASS